MIHVEGHTMVGFGYKDSSNLMYIHDTWDHNIHTMTWGDSYAGMQHLGVTIVQLEPLYWTTDVSVGDAQVQYSDSVLLEATLTAAASGLPLDGATLSFDVAGVCSGSAVTGADGKASIVCGPVGVPEGDYTINVAFAGDDVRYLRASAGTATLTVDPEAATVEFDGDNPPAVRVAEDGGNSGEFSLIVYVTETQPDQPEGSSAAGNISNAQVSMSLVPVGPGSSESVTCSAEVIPDGLCGPTQGYLRF
jgi:hypothetical protein